MTLSVSIVRQVISKSGGDVPSQTRRRSPLTRQPILTQHYRRHVTVAKTTSLPLTDLPPLNTDRYRQTKQTNARTILTDIYYVNLDHPVGSLMLLSSDSYPEHPHRIKKVDHAPVGA